MLPVEMKMFKEYGAGVESQQRGRADSQQVPVLCKIRDLGVLMVVNIATAVAKLRGNLLPLSSG